MPILGLCNGKHRIHAVGRLIPVDGGEASRSVVGAHRWRVPMSPLRQLVWRFRSQWRHAAAVGLRRGRQVRFGYDPESYSQNFDDGAVPDGRSSSPPRLPLG